MMQRSSWRAPLVQQWLVHHCCSVCNMTVPCCRPKPLQAGLGAKHALHDNAFIIMASSTASGNI